MYIYASMCCVLPLPQAIACDATLVRLLDDYCSTPTRLLLDSYSTAPTTRLSLVLATNLHCTLLPAKQ